MYVYQARFALVQGYEKKNDSMVALTGTVFVFYDAGLRGGVFARKPLC